MTERQDLRPLSTEDLLPDHDRTRADDPNRTDTTDEYRDGQYATGTDVDRDRTDVTDTTGYHDSDADRSVVSDQYDDVDTDNRQPTGSEKYDGQYDGQPTALDETTDQHQTVADDSAVAQDETTQDDVVQQKPAETQQDEGAAPLFTGEEVDRFRTEWRGLQSDFVDSPRDAVQHADQLVAQVMQSLATTFADHKKSLEGQWSKGEQVETEELRVALRQYRAFFDKLLTV
jgi:hypothetical protein